MKSSENVTIERTTVPAHNDSHRPVSETPSSDVDPSNTPPFSFNVIHFLVGSSLPLCLGAYAGYRRQMKAALQENKGCEFASRRAAAEAPVLASRALVIGSVLSFGGVGLLGAGILYASGCRSVDEAVSCLKVWAPAKRRQVAEWFGLDYVPKSARHPDVIATRNMSQDEELEYLRKKCFSDWTKDE